MQAGFRNNKPIGYQQIPAVAADVGFTLTPPAGATNALIICEAQAIRWRDDGQAASSTVGMPLAVGKDLFYDGRLSTFNLISQAAGAIVNIAYFA
jgi:hypothetical protein